MNVLNKALAVLLSPITLLERKLLDDDIKEKYGVISRKESVTAQFERWGLMVLGVYCGMMGSAYLLIGGAVTIGFLIAGFIDPFIWARKDGMQMFLIKRGDFKLGVVVNLAPIWIFWVGFLMGGVMNVG